MSKLGAIALAAMPWAIIIALLGAALFIKPQPVGQTVSPPVRESRDHFFGLAVDGAEHIWLAGNDGKIVVSTDAGHTWFAQISGTEQHLQDIAAWDAHRLVAVGNDGVVLVTENGGQEWRQASVPRSKVFNKLMRVIALPDGRALAVGAMGAMLLSTDYGAHWQRVRPEEDIAWNGVAIGGDALWVVGEFGRLAKSVDQGNTWQDIHSPVDSSLTGIAFQSASYGVAVGLDGVVLTTQDGGATWQVEDSVTEEHLFDVTNGPNGWVAVGNKNLVLSSAGVSSGWSSRRLSERDLAWHTEVYYANEKFYLVGASFGVFVDSQWHKL